MFYGSVQPGSTGEMASPLTRTKRPLALSVVLGLGLLVLLSIFSTSFSDARKNEASAFVQQRLSDLHIEEKRPVFPNLATVGHLKPDLDSVSGAVAAAYIFNGVPTSPGPINPETAYALKLFGIPVPIMADDASLADKEWLLVDHGSKSANFMGDNDDDVVGLIDHHALAEDLIDLRKPVFVSIRPWGSVNTVLAYMASGWGVPLPKNISGLMLTAIISDTLNLRSPTTTAYDRKAYHALGASIGLQTQSDFNQLALGLFRAKSDTAGMSERQIVLLDYKESVSNGTLFAWASGETVDAAEYLSRADKFIAAMKQVKAERGLKLLFFSATDISPSLERPNTVVFLASEEEQQVAKGAFPQGKVFNGNPNLLDVGPLMSRKMQFKPAILAQLEKQ